jgi:23S rRNA (guanine745-N1)-methyltransferase
VLDDAVPYLACPHCGGGLRRADGTLRCGEGHAFDIAREGYVSLLPAGARGVGDTAAMVAARAEFLAAGYFAGLAGELAELAAQAAAAVDADGRVHGRVSGGVGAGIDGGADDLTCCIADVGAGTGYYLAATLDRQPDRIGLALDASKFALRRAARAHPRIGAVRCDAWSRLPVATGAVAVALNVFAPREPAELSRVLHPAGRLLVATPTRDHLAELVGRLGLLTVDERKQERLAQKLDPCFDLVDTRSFRCGVLFDRRAVAAAVGMGPSAWHAAGRNLDAAVDQLPEPVAATLSVTVSVYRPRPEARPEDPASA